MSSLRKFKILVTWMDLYFFFAVASLLMPIGLGNILPSITSLYRIFQLGYLLSAIIIAFLVNKRLSPVTWIIIVYYLSSCCISKFYLGNDISYWESIIVISLSIICSFGYRNYRKIFLRSFVLYFEIMAIIQIVLQLIFPNGMYENEGYFQNWILGYKNIPVRFLLPGACLELLLFTDRYEKEHSFSSIVRVAAYLVAFSYIVLTTESATSIVGLLAFWGILCFSFFFNRNFPKIVNFLNIAIISMICFLLIYFANIQHYFEYFIIIVLGKSTNFTGRTRVWDICFNLLDKMNLLFGVGMQKSLKTILHGFNHAHQYWLNIFITSGIIGFGFHVLIYAVATYQVRDFTETKSIKIIITTMIAFMIMGIDESLVYGYMILPLLVIASEYNKQNNRVLIRI